VEEETEWNGFLVAINKGRQDSARKGPDLETYDRKQLTGQQELSGKTGREKDCNGPECCDFRRRRREKDAASSLKDKD
jgi:hypothetical protein